MSSLKHLGSGVISWRRVIGGAAAAGAVAAVALTTVTALPAAAQSDWRAPANPIETITTPTGGGPAGTDWRQRP